MLWSVLLGLLASACGEEARNGAAQHAEMTLADFGSLGGDFALQDHQGRPFALSQARGRVVLLFFGYTHCPDFCPLALSRVARALELVGPARERVLVVLVSVDPGRDDPARLSQYLSGFGLSAIGLTGTESEVAAVARQYGATYERQPATSEGGYAVDHSTYLYLIDPAGRLRYLFGHQEPPERLAAGIQAVLVAAGP
jgi:protein SCO1/2